jgi:hypothetical protein
MQDYIQDLRRQLAQQQEEKEQELKVQLPSEHYACSLVSFKILSTCIVFPVCSYHGHARCWLFTCLQALQQKLDQGHASEVRALQEQHELQCAVLEDLANSVRFNCEGHVQGDPSRQFTVVVTCHQILHGYSFFLSLDLF